MTAELTYLYYNTPVVWVAADDSSTFSSTTLTGRQPPHLRVTPEPGPAEHSAAQDMGGHDHVTSTSSSLLGTILVSPCPSAAASPTSAAAPATATKPNLSFADGHARGDLPSLGLHGVEEILQLVLFEPLEERVRDRLEVNVKVV